MYKTSSVILYGSIAGVIWQGCEARLDVTCDLIRPGTGITRFADVLAVALRQRDCDFTLDRGFSPDTRVAVTREAYPRKGLLYTHTRELMVADIAPHLIYKEVE